MKLVYEFSEEEFVHVCSDRVRRNGTTIFEDLYDSIRHFLNSPVDEKSLIKKINHKYKSEYYDNHMSLPEYIDQGYLELYYPSMDLYSDKDTPLDVDEVILPKFISQLDIKYGGGIKKKIKVKTHNLKTKSKITVELLHLKIPAEIIRKIYESEKFSNIELIPSKLGVWEWRQTFYNKISGDCYFCKCFEGAIEKDGEAVNNGTHPHIKQAVSRKLFKKDICHLCAKSNSDLFFCHPMYASSFKVKYGAYIRKFEIDERLDEKKAENIVREMKGVAKIGERWINETLLFNYINVLFSHFSVQREASPPWLGSQRLDIFVPELKLAIEYQGQQHFKPVELFGGKEGLVKAKERDKEKLVKCKKNGINLIYFTYKDELSEKLVIRRLKKYLCD